MNQELGRWISRTMKGTEPFRDHCICRPTDESEAIREETGYAHDGAVSATMTVYLRLGAAAFRKASTVLDWPIVRMISLQ